MKANHKSISIRACFRLLLFIWISLLLVGCKRTTTLAPSLCQALFEDTQAFRASLSNDDVVANCTDIASGSVVEIEILENDYLPVYVDFSSSGFFWRAVPLEQWSITHVVVTVKIEDVSLGKVFNKGGTATFNIPMELQELAWWDEVNPKFTGRRFSMNEIDMALPQIGDLVTIMRGPSEGNHRMTGKLFSFAFLGEQRINIGWLYPGSLDGRYLSDSETEPHWRRNVVSPRREGTTILEAAFLEPMKERQKYSYAMAKERSGFVVRGVVQQVAPVTYPVSIYYKAGLNENPLEQWNMEAWTVSISITEIIKETGNSLDANAELFVTVPKCFSATETGSKISMNGSVPSEGSEVTICWNEGYQRVAVDWLIRTSKDAIDILYGYIINNQTQLLDDQF